TGLDLARLDSLLVGIHDGNGHCLGLGRLEHEDGTLRVLTNVGEGMKGLRPGSLRIDLETFETKPVSLREVMFGVWPGRRGPADARAKGQRPSNRRQRPRTSTNGLPLP